RELARSNIRKNQCNTIAFPPALAAGIDIKYSSHGLRVHLKTQGCASLCNTGVGFNPAYLKIRHQCAGGFAYGVYQAGLLFKCLIHFNETIVVGTMILVV